MFLQVPVVLLLWRGPEPLSFETPQLLPQETQSNKLPVLVTGHPGGDPGDVLAVAAGDSSGPALEQVYDTPDTNEPASAPQTPDRFAPLGAANARASLHQRTQLVNATAASPSTPETPPVAKRAQHGQQPEGGHAFTELSKLRATRLEAADGKVPTLELPAASAIHPEAFSAFGSPVETTRSTSPVSPLLTPGTTFGSPVDLPEGFTAVRQSDGQRQARASLLHNPGQDSHANRAASDNRLGSRHTEAAGTERRAAHQEAQCQPGSQPGDRSFEKVSPDAQERDQPAGRSSCDASCRQPGNGSSENKVRYSTLHCSLLLSSLQA